mmetsp:Transcript_8078/g.17491  ORF Transcript_8078/g.17491 Transcript_8078/m.17491 type:complete len:286 (+) Transcript_8078:1-858(+)
MQPATQLFAGGVWLCLLLTLRTTGCLALPGFSLTPILWFGFFLLALRLTQVSPLTVFGNLGLLHLVLRALAEIGGQRFKVHPSVGEKQAVGSACRCSYTLDVMLFGGKNLPGKQRQVDACLDSLRQDSTDQVRGIGGAWNSWHPVFDLSLVEIKVYRPKETRTQLRQPAGGTAGQEQQHQQQAAVRAGQRRGHGARQACVSQLQQDGGRGSLTLQSFQQYLPQNRRCAHRDQESHIVGLGFGIGKDDAHQSLYGSVQTLDVTHGCHRGDQPLQLRQLCSGDTLAS